MPKFVPAGGSEACRTNLGDSSLGWTWERSGKVHKMMQRMNTVLPGVKIWTSTRSFYEFSFVRAPRPQLGECRRHCKHRHGWMVWWYIILTGFLGKVWIAWTYIPLVSGDRWFKSSKTQPLFSRRWYTRLTKACLDNQRFWISLWWVLTKESYLFV